MTTNDFKQMSRKELKKYILEHPTDDEAIEELFISRRDPNVRRIPYEMPHEEVETIFKAAIIKGKTSNQVSQ